MKHGKKTRELLTKHCQAHPQLQIQDIFKYIFQSSFGCEHMVSSFKTAVEHILNEYGCLAQESGIQIDTLDGAYSRVPLAYLNEGLGAETLAKLFCASAKNEPDGKTALLQKLQIAKELVHEGLIPFTPIDFEKAVGKWEAQGYQALHHSDVFLAAYRPSYRVIANRYVPFLPLFARLDEKLKRGSAILAIEGGSASGKTTLSEMLQGLYECTVFHMDDFFLRPEQRTPARYAEVGGNVDRERFLEEVLLPLSNNQPIRCQKFDCSTQKLEPPTEITPKKLTVIEGVYSMHPELESFYDLSVFLNISPEEQKKRIAKRNSPQMAKRFFDEWIPLEALYFSKTEAQKRCDLSIENSEK